MQAVILAGGLETNLSILTRRYPKALLHVANQPLIDYVLSYLRQWEIRDVIFCLNENTGILKEYLNQARFKDFTFRFYEEPHPRGTAGTLVDIRKWLTDEHVLILNGNLVSQMDISTLVHYHDLKKSYFTIVTGYPLKEAPQNEEIILRADGSVQSVRGQNYASESLYRAVPLGLYLLNPKILEIFSRYKGYLDLKEQFVAALRKQNIPVFTYVSSEFTRSVRTIEDYVQLNFDVLYQNWMTNFWGSQFGNQVWAGRGVQIDDSAEIIGPVVLGEYTTISAGVRIIGPAVIGKNCHFAENSFLRESVVWNHTVFRRASHVEFSLVGEGFTIQEKSYFSRQVMLDMPFELGEINLLPRNMRIESILLPEPVPVLKTLQIEFFRIAKRSLDVLGAVFLLALFAPVWVLSGLFVLLGSGFPIFEKERRLGLQGKPFFVYRFRTKKTDGKKANKTVSGEFTRVGKFLKLLNVDELPELFSVLKGDMSLVGPRPLDLADMRFSPGWRDVRLRVKPGITGLWQISGENKHTFHEWIRNDIFYVRNQSFLLDVKILLKTPFRLLRGKQIR